jgi:CheY-like chemotaxis protein
VRKTNINLGSLAFLIADSNPHSLTNVHGILRGFGAMKINEVRDANMALQVLNEHRPDIFLCDAKLPAVGGVEFIRFIRGRADLPFRTLPILVTTSDLRVSEIRRMRDCGANMVIAKPMSPATLYERLVWVAFNPRKFVETEKYFGPDRRYGREEPPGDIGQRSDDNFESVGDDAGPPLSQTEIDAVLNSARGA